MLVARRVSVWKGRYEVTADDRVVAGWAGFTWRRGGEVEFEGRRYQVRGNAWGTWFSMVDDAGTVVATAGRVGRKRWTVDAAGQTYHFRRSRWRGEQQLLVDDQRVGAVTRKGFWRSRVLVDLPGLPLLVQLFVLGVVVTMWSSEAAAATAAASG